MTYAQRTPTSQPQHEQEQEQHQASTASPALQSGDSWLGDVCSGGPPTADDLHALDIAVTKLEAVFDFAAQTLQDSLGAMASEALTEVRASPAAWFGTLAGDQAGALVSAATKGAGPVAALAGVAVRSAVDTAVGEFLASLEGQVVDDATIRAFFHRYTLGWRLGFLTTAGALADHGADEVRDATAALEQLTGPAQGSTIEALKGAMIPPFLDLAARSTRPNDRGTVSSRYSLTAIITPRGDGAAELYQVHLPTDLSVGDASALRATPGALEHSAVRLVASDQRWFASATSAGVDLAQVDPTARRDLQRMAEPDEARLDDLRLRQQQGDTEAAAILVELEQTAVVLMWSDILLQAHGLSLDELGVPVRAPAG